MDTLMHIVGSWEQYKRGKWEIRAVDQDVFLVKWVI